MREKISWYLLDEGGVATSQLIGWKAEHADWFIRQQAWRQTIV